MARLPAVPGVVVAVEVGGTKRREYKAPENEAVAADPKAVTKYIEVVPDARYGIRIRFVPGRFALSDSCVQCLVFRDGLQAACLSFEPKHIESLEHGFLLDTVLSVTPNGVVGQQMVFSALQIGEASSSSDLANQPLEDLGSIRVEFYHIRFGNATPDPLTKAGQKKLNRAQGGGAVMWDEIPSSSVQGGKVAETALRGRDATHQTGLTPPKPRWKQRIDRREMIRQGDGQPIATFVFKYRSQAILQSLGLIPYDENPIPVEDRPYESLTSAERRELFKRQRERRAHQDFLESIVGKKRYHEDTDDEEGEIDEEEVGARRVNLAIHTKRPKTEPGAADVNKDDDTHDEEMKEDHDTELTIRTKICKN